ncbi:MAG TPA: DUF1569 domain-containing protein [Thermoanaerobaculia bacterium]|nr:DUF1569 domain-containing protein [Thermoanaerobaculia bacterium]
MKSMWEQQQRDEVFRRLEALQSGTPGRWGKMTAEKMVAHLVDSMRMANGELPVRPKKLPVRFFPLNYLVIYFAPFPKGAPTAPELMRSGDPQELNASKRELMEGIDRFRTSHGQTRQAHPAFGRLNDKAWGVLTYRHIDHHFRQFGV